MLRAIDKAMILVNNFEILPSQINRYIKDVSINLYNEKIIERIDKLETCVYQSSIPDYECPICTEPIKDGMILTSMPCGHKIHHHCTIKLVMTSLNNILCPLCRVKIIEIPIDNTLESQVLFKPNQPIMEIHSGLIQLVNILKNLGNTNTLYQTIPFTVNK